MRTGVALLAAALAVAWGQDCSLGDGLRPHPSVSCSPDYFVCFKGASVAKQCPIGLIFDPDALRCAQSAPGCDFDCGDREDGMYADGCSEHFWWCWNNMATRHMCGHGLVFDMHAKECTYRHFVPACGGTRPVTELTTARAPVDQVDFDCMSHENGDHQYETGECSGAYVSCSNGLAYARQCPGGLVFDPSTRFCDRRANVLVCGGTAATPTEAPTSGICTARHHGFRIPNGQCSQSYTRCINELPTTVFCPEGQVYSTELGCDPPEWVRECPEYIPPTTTTARAPPTGPCADEHDGATVEITSCSNMFFVCRAGLPTVQSCDVGEVFSARVGCAEPELIAECRPATTSTTSRAPTTQAGFCSSRSDGEYALGECSEEYISCCMHQTTHQRCAPGKVFDAEFGSCSNRDFVPRCAPATTTRRAPVATTRATTTTARPTTTTQRQVPSTTFATSTLMGPTPGNPQTGYRAQQTYDQPQQPTYQQQQQGYLAAPPNDQVYAVAAPGGCAQRQLAAHCVCVLAPGCMCNEVEHFQDPNFVPAFGCVAHTEIAPCQEEFNFCSDGQTFPSWCEPGHVFDEHYQGCIHHTQAPGCIQPEPEPRSPYALPENDDTYAHPEPRSPYTQSTQDVYGQTHYAVPDVAQTYAQPSHQPFTASEQPYGGHHPVADGPYDTPNGGYDQPPSTPERHYGEPVAEQVYGGGHVANDVYNTPSGGYGQRQLTPTQYYTAPEPEQTPRQCVEGVAREVGLCLDFFEACELGQFVQKFCPAGTLFDQIHCIAPCTAGRCCPVHPDLPAQPEPIAEPEPVCDDLDTAPAGPCNEQFYECRQGAWTLQWCQPGLVYCPLTGHCLRAAAVDTCDVAEEDSYNKFYRVPVQDEAEEETYAVDCIDNSRVAKSICVPEFFLCQGNVWTDAVCPQGHVFDTDAAACLVDSPACTPAQDHEPPQAPVCIDTSTAPAGPCHDQFYECVANAWTLQQCPDGLIYCPATHHCRPSTDVATCPRDQPIYHEDPVFQPVCPSYGAGSPYCVCAK